MRLQPFDHSRENNSLCHRENSQGSRIHRICPSPSQKGPIEQRVQKTVCIICHGVKEYDLDRADFRACEVVKVWSNRTVQFTACAKAS